MVALLHRAGVAFLIGAVAFSSIGISVVTVPAPRAAVAAAEDGEDFPCKDHHCGCISAEMCRTNCCCIKPAAKAEPTCCGHAAPADSPPPARPAARRAPATPIFALVLQSPTCGGRGALWMLKTVTWWTQAEAPPALRPNHTAVTDVLPTTQPESRVLRPDPPPPRSC